MRTKCVTFNYKPHRFPVLCGARPYCLACAFCRRDVAAQAKPEALKDFRIDGLVRLS